MVENPAANAGDMGSYEESRAVKFDREVILTNMKEELCGEKVTELTLAPKKIVTVKF